MAQIIPSITSLPIDSSAAPSVEDIQDRLPSICVDYLSHDWSEEDVWASWRSMTRHKHEIANGVRLENASWRTWQKQRNKLKTISPETLNWLKDSDVTWLYGPLHTANVEPVRPMKVSSTGDKYGLDTAKTKPILKHRTLSEMLTIHNPSSPILEASSRGDDDDVPSMDRPPLVQTKSDTNIVRVRTGGLKGIPGNAAEQELTAPSMSENSSAEQSVVPDAPSTGKRHISFNTFVEQVIAVDDPTEGQNQSSDSEDEMLEIRSNSSRNSSRSSRPSLSRNSSSGSGSGGEHLTIAKIAPTMLKTNGVYHSSLPAMVYAPTAEYRSPEAEQPAIDFPSPKQSKGRTWSEDEDEDYSSVGYDYYPNQQQGAPSHVVRAGTSPQTSNQSNLLRPPVPAGNQESVSTSLSSSTSSSSANLSTSPSQPSRSILKVRPPTNPPKEDSPPSPPSSTYFNYNPSAATGIGGMRSSGGVDFVGGSGSPSSPGAIGAAAPATGGASEERGRSTSRSQQTSAYGRSSSGSASVGSASSISPGASRQLELPNSSNKQQKSVSQQPGPSLGQVVEGNGRDAEAPLDEHMDVDNYSPDRSETPTPHSSPQIVFRPLKDTSPASLPHNSTARPSQPHFQSSSFAQPPRNSDPTQTQTPSPELPKADPLRVVSPVASTRTTSRATTAHVGTNAAPTLANNSEPTSTSLYRTQSNSQVPPTSTTGQSNTPAYGQIHRPYSGANGEPQHQRNNNNDSDDEGEEDDDGSSIMGRAANIANTAKDLLGALWFGANDQRNGNGNAGASGAGSGLRRHGSHT